MYQHGLQAVPCIHGTTHEAHSHTDSIYACNSIYGLSDIVTPNTKIVTIDTSDSGLKWCYCTLFTFYWASIAKFDGFLCVIWDNFGQFIWGNAK